MPEAVAPNPSRLLAHAAALDRLAEELSRAARYGRDLTVLRVVAQLLPSESLALAEAKAVDAVISAQLRNTDRVGRLEDNSYLVLLPEADDVAGSIVAQRIASDLTRRSGAVLQRKWLVGQVNPGSTAPTIDEVLTTSLQAALDSYRNAA